MTSEQSKLLELSKKILANEEEILKQEKFYNRVLTLGLTVNFLVRIREKIKKLYRKNLLFNQVIDLKLKTTNIQ